ncbi:MAG: DUF4388 domain-containing protein [Deltaproteobacteria bacterium]|nr:DUF4388 domain-containing protein [Deltaproteobacteria bacterium]
MYQAGTDQYLTLRNALLEMGDDSSAVGSLLSFQADNGAWWIEVAYQELRMCLIQGNLTEAETVGGLIGSVLEVQEEEPDANHAHCDAMRALLYGISAILDNDVQSGIGSLDEVTSGVYGQSSLRWAAWFWISRGATAAGQIEEAVDSARRCLELGERLDAVARSISLRNVAEVEFLSGDHYEAIEHVNAAIRDFIQLNETHAHAVALLSRAKMEAWSGSPEDAVASAREAHQVDPAWRDPLLFQARQALLIGESGQVAALLLPLLSRDQPSREVVQELLLAELLEAGEVSKEVMVRFCRLRDLPPTPQRIHGLEQLVEAAPDFWHLRDLLGWNLIKLGKDEEAAPHFEHLSAQLLDQDLQASVLLALGCLANRRHSGSKPGMRLRHTADVSRKYPSATGLPAVSATELAGSGGILSVGAALATPGEEEVDLWREAQDIFDSESMVAVQSADPMPSISERSAKKSPEGSVAKAAFTGDLQLLAVPDLLDFLKSSRRTGTLVITSEEGVGAVHLRKGKITGAASPSGRHLGEILKEIGSATEEALAAAADLQKSEFPDSLLGTVLVREGAVEELEVRKALSIQVISVIMEMLDWASGRFAFEPEQDGAEEEDIAIELDTQGVLLDALREYDEVNR